MRPGAAPAGPGSRLWIERYDQAKGGRGLSTATKVAVSPSGGTVYVTGFSQAEGTTFDVATTVAYDATTGARLWSASYNDPGSSDTTAAVVVSPSGGTVYVTGTSLQAVTGDLAHDAAATVAYDAATGAQLWAARYSGAANRGGVADSVAVSPSGPTVFVTGFAPNKAGSENNFATIAYDAAAGTRLWVTRYVGTATTNGVADSVAVSPSGATVFVTGDSQAGSSGAYVTVGYDPATGAQLWAARYTGHGSRGAIALAVSPSGNTVYVTGAIFRAGSDFDAATVAYNAATGAQLWAARYDGPANGDDIAAGLAVSPTTGTVFVTGERDTTDPHADIATVAYHG
jgi:hypothetical protein